MQIRLLDGSTKIVEGAEPGSCGRPLDEQRMVVAEKLATVGLREPSARGRGGWSSAGQAA
jgi:hypothetical protein